VTASVERRFTAVVNPTAGRGAAPERLVPVARRLREAGAAVTVEHSRDLDHAHELATTAVGRGEMVIAVGGDGLMRALAQAVVDGDGLLGLVPAGRGNDLARQLGLPRDPSGIAEIMITRKQRRIDVIEVESETERRLVVGSVYAGIDAAANTIVNRSPRIPARLVYPYAALRALARWRPVRYQIDIDGEERSILGYTVVVANSGFYGGGLHIAPDARIDDGLLDVVIVADCPRRVMAAALREVYSGTHVRRPEVTVLRGSEVRVAAEPAILAFGDGDSIGVLPLTARIRPQALSVLAP
jgi:diacylglycerol kinase (ATP)